MALVVFHQFLQKKVKANEPLEAPRKIRFKTRLVFSRIPYQEAFKFFCFCDVDPVIFFNNFNMLDFIIKPARERAEVSGDHCRDVSYPKAQPTITLQICPVGEAGKELGLNWPDFNSQRSIWCGCPIC